MSEKIKLFISYAHKNHLHFNELDRHLKSLKEGNSIVSWDDRMIEPGQDWDQEIKSQIQQAQVILLLLSSDFFNSNYINGVEMKIAIDRHDNGTAKILPILVSSCVWDAYPIIGKLQMLNDKPIDKYSVPKRQEMWVNIVRKITNALPSLKSDKNYPDPKKELREQVKRMEKETIRGDRVDPELLRHYEPQDERRLDRTFHQINFTELKSFLENGQTFSMKKKKGFFALCSLEGHFSTGVGRWGIDAVRSTFTDTLRVIEIKAKGVDVDRQVILTGLASSFQIEPKVSTVDPFRLIDAIATSMHETKKIIVWIHDGDSLVSTEWNWLVSEFWQPLCGRLSSMERQLSTALLMFVVTKELISDNKAGHHFCDDINNPDQSKILKIPLERNWQREMLLYYISNEWPKSYRNDDALERMVDNIFKGTENGIPSYIYNNCQEYLTATIQPE